MGGACNALFQSDRSINSACSSEAYTVPNAPGTLNRFPLTQLLACGESLTRIRWVKSVAKVNAVLFQGIYSNCERCSLSYFPKEPEENA